MSVKLTSADGRRKSLTNNVFHAKVLRYYPPSHTSYLKMKETENIRNVECFHS